jgi:hypothetical protein
MYIINRHSKHGTYKAKVLQVTPLQDWKFQVEYYDDEGELMVDVVESQDLEEDKNFST